MNISAVTIVKRLLLLGYLSVMPTQADFDPRVLSQSTVKIVVKGQQGVLAVASGFLWQRNDLVVTSLHVMSNAPKTWVIVEFGRIKRRASIAAVLPGADLVLLKVSRPVPRWIALTEFNPVKPKYKSAVSALGFNRGSQAMSSRELVKGYVNPEILQVLLPAAALAKLKQSQLLDVRLPIYYFDGSLLPGFSGAPVVNSAGELIGIGDGGLENGASSVSWVIPAYYLPALTASKLNRLPPALGLVTSTFSDFTIPTPQSKPQQTKWVVRDGGPLLVKGRMFCHRCQY